MDNQRLKLQKMLEEILGSRNVYFQPPSTIKMNYPAIVYSKEPSTSLYADNKHYVKNTPYQITLIDANPDSELVDKIAELPLCRHAQSFTSSNLHHNVFTLYF